MKTVFCLGRYGDICNALPIAWDIWQTTGERPQFMVAASHADILDGVSYVIPKIWSGRCDEHRQALVSLGPKGGEIINVMIFNHDQYTRHYETDSYQKESWRIAGYSEKFGKLPLVFDRRNVDREIKLFRSFVPQDWPFIFVCVDGISSPFNKADELISKIQAKCLNCVVVDSRKVKAHRIYDLLGIMEEAECVVSIDSVFLHLARTCRTPVIALINNGWCGSVPPSSSRSVFRYKDALENIDLVVKSVKEAVS